MLLRDVAIFCGFIVFMCVLADWWNVYKLDSDEGINLEKAVLVANGHSLYSEIWSDQPPLFTYILSIVHIAFPFSITAARGIMLVFASLLVVCLFRIVQRFEGSLAALVSVMLLVSSELFLTLSPSVMIGLPSIALAMVAMDILTANGRSPPTIALIAAGMIFAASIAIKMFSVILLPTLLIVLILDENSRPNLHTTARAAVFLVVAGVSTVLFLFVLGGVAFDQIIDPHEVARSTSVFADKGGLIELVETVAAESSAAFSAGLIFATYLFLNPKQSHFLPAGWLAVGVLVLGTHRPLWSHQTLAILPALCWLGGAGFSAMLAQGKKVGLLDKEHSKLQPFTRTATLVGLSAACVIIVVKMGEDFLQAHRKLTREPELIEQAANTSLRIIAPKSGNAIADDLMDAYRAGLTATPATAVWSAKRMETGFLTEDDILAEMSPSDIDATLLRRFEYSPDFIARAGTVMDNVTPAFNRLSLAEPMHIFDRPEGPPEAMTETEKRIRSGLEAFEIRNGLGGVWKGGRHYDRVQSNSPLPAQTIVTRPPGSAQELGSCLLAASNALHSTRLLLDALSIGRAISCVQTEAGGWPNKSQPASRCVTGSAEEGDNFNTFDDGTMPSILYFAFDLMDTLKERQVDRPRWLTKMTDRALDLLVRAQDANGGWPQQVGQVDGYHQLATLNDDVVTGLIRLLLIAHTRTKDPRYLEAAVRGGDFLLDAQGPPGQAGFAQQYSKSLKPAAGRSFEPAAYSSLETAYAINTLIDLYLATERPQYLDAADRAADWLRESTLSPDFWARYYEAGSNRPIYSDREGRITDDISKLPEERRQGYRWEGGIKTFPAIGRALERLEALHEDEEGLRRMDEAFDRAAILADVPAASLQLDGRQVQHSPEMLNSTREFADFCAGEIATTLQSDG